MKSLAARATLFTRQLVGRSVQHRVADVAFLDALKVLVHVPLPQPQSVHHGTVLNHSPTSDV